MKLTLLGTGSADGWPNPFCTCASCTWAREAGVIRGSTSVLVNGDLLLDCGPEVPRAALRLGHTLADVRHLLLSHASPGLAGPAALRWRAQAQRTEPLDLIGPPAALAVCADWLGPTDPVRQIAVRPGDRLRVGQYDLRVLAADSPADAVLYDLRNEQRSSPARMLYAVHTGPLPTSTLDAVTGAGYDAVLLELTGTGTGDQHLDGDSFPHQVAELRRRRAVTESTRVVAIHLGHRNPPGEELVRRLACWGATAPPDGSVLGLGVPGTVPTPSRHRPRRVLILGGARSGKSAEAERRLAAEPNVTYVATGPAAAPEADPEWAARVAQHVARRPPGWRTLETTDLPPVLRDATGSLLIDCVTLWLAAHPEDAPAADALVEAWRDTTAHAVLVSNEVGSGVHPATAVGRSFRDALGTLNARLAAVSDEAWLVTAGIARRLS